MSGPGHRSLARGGCSRHKGDHTQLTTMGSRRSGTWGVAPVDRVVLGGLAPAPKGEGTCSSC